MAFFEQINLIDATTLYSNTSVTAAFTSTAIDTMNYGSIVIEVDSTGGNVINAIVEGSNDGTDGWYSILLNPTQDLSVTDVITGEGHYTFNAQARYIRVNATQVSGGTYAIIIVGRSGAGPDAAEKLTAAFDKNTPLNVNIASGVLLDSNKAVILSDGVQYPIKVGNSTTYAIIDCAGYNSFSFQIIAGTATVTIQQSNDGVSFFTAYGYSTQYSASGSSGLVNGYYWTGPINSRYLRFIANSSTISNGILVLKQAQWVSAGFNGYGQSVNIQAWAGTNVPSNGLPVQGYYNSNAQTSVPPITIGGQYFDGSSPTPYIKTLQTDVVGRLLISTGGYQLPGNNYTSGSVVAIAGSNPGANNQTQATAIPGMATAGSNPYNVNTILTQEVAQFEGQSQIELLAQILLELKIMNQQMYELPRLIATNQSSTDPPETFRQEPSIFTI
jgi:hypothetical protein